MEGTQKIYEKYEQFNTTNKELHVRSVQFEEMPLTQQSRIKEKSDIMILADGTGVINGMYMPTNSCIISILPFGVNRYIPEKGNNFKTLFTKLDFTYITLNSREVENSGDIIKRAAEKETAIERWVMLSQNINVTQWKT